jgi:hypothetical protein
MQNTSQDDFSKYRRIVIVLSKNDTLHKCIFEQVYCRTRHGAAVSALSRLARYCSSLTMPLLINLVLHYNHATLHAIHATSPKPQVS